MDKTMPTKGDTMASPKGDLYRKVRVIYIKTDFFDSLMRKALEKYGFRMSLAKALGYSSPSALKQNTEKKGILMRRFLKLCEIAGVEIKEVEPHIVAVAFYGNRKKRVWQRDRLPPTPAHRKAGARRDQREP